jgi:hypothetical protein
MATMTRTVNWMQTLKPMLMLEIFQLADRNSKLLLNWWWQPLFVMM